ncbi:class I SAM-dependent methyltransferase [Labrys sp. KNU-23]|uniref:class I SAM-dependent methyltransferase n=1 Tax=Labrys sp. KNU-23 TaxID=2789216 RepID=UPI0011F01A3A|nr:class I SAM-dependent methyltransferase [Labrys sp. KNU-23]QEN89592.1 class I SAM-dependent methyltransferase [Labrys sp. KNU-23]
MGGETTQTRDHAGGSHIFFSRDSEAEQDRLIGDFRDFIRNSISSVEPVLEIGPSYRPVLPKSRGFNVETVDHADQETLQRIYTAHGVDVALIETVDHVWTGGPISALTGEGRFNLVLASHVVEHTTNLAGFLADCMALLSQGGRLALIVPDKRYCFDFFQPATDIAKVMADYRENRSRHTFEAFYRWGASIEVLSDGRADIAWGQGWVKDFAFAASFDRSRCATAEASSTAPDYVDSHEYYLTPSGLALILLELRQYEILDATVETLTRARGCEFLVMLRKGGGMPLSQEAYQAVRRRLQLQLISEQVEAWSMFGPLVKDEETAAPALPADMAALHVRSRNSGFSASKEGTAVNWLTHLPSLEAHIAKLEAHIGDLEPRSARLEAQIDILERENAQLQRVTSLMRGSASWRLTKPLRSVSAQLKRLKMR